MAAVDQGWSRLAAPSSSARRGQAVTSRLHRSFGFYWQLPAQLGAGCFDAAGGVSTCLRAEHAHLFRALGAPDPGHQPVRATAGER